MELGDESVLTAALTTPVSRRKTSRHNHLAAVLRRYRPATSATWCADANVVLLGKRRRRLAGAQLCRQARFGPAVDNRRDAGQHSLAVTQTGGGFSWDSYITLTGDQLSAFSLALTDNHANYRLEFDVTYNTASIPQNAGVTFLNESVAINNAAGNWTQVDGLGSTNGRTNQTIHVAIPLTSWTALAAGSSSYTIYFALNGNWGSLPATVYFDNLRLVNLIAPLTGDFNHDGYVDAADYTIWRHSFGSTTNLAADGNINGLVDTGDYDLWRANFGHTAGSGSGVEANAAVPEPAMFVQLIVGMLVMCSCRRAAVH